MDKIIKEPEYQELINYIKNNTNLKVEDLDFQMKAIFNKSIALSNKSEDDLIIILKTQTDKLKSYISVFYNFDIDNDQEYDELEEPDNEEEKDKLLIADSTSYGVIVNFLIVFSYLTDDDITGFDEYLKKKKIPKRKKYIQEIQEIYKKAVRS